MTVATKEVVQIPDVPDEVQRWTARRKAAVALGIVKGETSAAEAALLAAFSGRHPSGPHARAHQAPLQLRLPEALRRCCASPTACS